MPEICLNRNKPWDSVPHPDQLLKKLDQNFYQNAITLRFSEQNYKLCYILRFWFSKALSNKISLAVILKRKSCICCLKHCRAYFHRHMECAVLKRFLKVQGTFFKKFLQIPLFHLEKLNLIRFIKALIKGFVPHPLRLRLSTFSRGEGFKLFRQTFPFRDGFRVGKAPMKGELSHSDWGVIISVR